MKMCSTLITLEEMKFKLRGNTFFSYQVSKEQKLGSFLCWEGMWKQCWERHTSGDMATAVKI